MKLHADSLIRTYGPLNALDGLTLSVEAGVLVLIGPSGGGKSTFLRLCGGLDEATSGTLQINDTPLGHDPATLLAWRRRNGFLFQQFNLFPHLTALRNITLPLEKVHGQSPPPLWKPPGAAWTVSGSWPMLTNFPRSCPAASSSAPAWPGPSRQARKFCCWMSPPPPWIPEMTAEVLELIQELAAAGQHIILSTHEMGFARAVADQVALIAAGKILETGPPAAVFGAPREELTQRFLAKVMRFA